MRDSGSPRLTLGPPARRAGQTGGVPGGDCGRGFGGGCGPGSGGNLGPPGFACFPLLILVFRFESPKIPNGGKISTRLGKLASAQLRHSKSIQPSWVVRAASTLFIQQDSQYQQSVFESSTVVKVALGIGSPFCAPRSDALLGG